MPQTGTLQLKQITRSVPVSRLLAFPMMAPRMGRARTFRNVTFPLQFYIFANKELLISFIAQKLYLNKSLYIFCAIKLSKEISIFKSYTINS